MGEIEANINERILEFLERAPEHYGNPEEVLEWWKKLETHLKNPKWRYKENAAVLHHVTSQEKDNTVYSHMISIEKMRNRSFLFRNFEQILTSKRWGEPETERTERTTVKPLITNTPEEFIRCRLDNFSTSFILYYVNFSICKNK